MSQNITEEKEIIKDVSEEAKSIPIENILEQPQQETNKEEKEDVLEEEQEELVVPEEEIKEKTKDIILKLGDIIIITNPTNEILNNNVFFIDYIDPNKIRLINSENFEKTTLQISPEGVIGDGSITSIKVISSNEKLGYARQNELLPGTWINIYFGGDIPAVITGQITNLEEDMIEIKTTDDDTLYINFNYQGIPEDLPIETFEIRPAPQAKEEIAEKEITADELVNLGEEELEENEASMPPITIPTNVIKEKIKRMMFDVTDIEFGDIIQVQEFVNVDKEKYRYNIETQTNDLLEEMISKIPNAQRTNNVLNSIHIMITRFIQLRDISSKFDTNKNVIDIIEKTADDRPLAEMLSEFKNNLYWIMLVATNIKKVYSDSEKDEFKRSEDYETIYLDENLLQMETLFKNYKSNVSTDGQNKYTGLYNSLESYLTPFFSVDPESSENVFNTNTNGIIIEGNVESNINAIIDNLGDLYSTIVDKAELKTRKFVIQRYNLGLDKLEATNLKGSKMLAHRVKLTNNDTISINSIVTLPEPAVQFSKINLPGTDLLVRANLNMHFLNYWQLLKQGTKYSKVVIDGLDNELEYDDSNFVDNIKQYMLDLSEYEKPTNLSNLDIYKIFLRTIIPKIRVLFLLVKKYIKGRLSLVDVVNYLEPFLIYPVDLTYMQYNEINDFINEKIKEYNIKFKEGSRAFSIIKHFKYKNIFGHNVSLKDKEYTFSNPLFELLNTRERNMETNFGALSQEIFANYGFDDSNQMKCSGSEFLKRIITDDYGNLYNTAVALTNINLMYPKELDKIFETDKEGLKSIMQRDSENDKCTTYVIAKKYYTKERLIEDNGKTIYFDKDYDTTNYELLEEKYKKERDQLTSEELILFLTEEFKKKNKKDEQTAEYMAETLVNQAKRVKDGYYALLANEENDEPVNLEYYIRQNDEWVLSNDVDPTLFIKDNDILCNINYDCMFNAVAKDEEKCESTDITKDTIVNNTLKQIIDQFDKHYDISKDELNQQINKHLKYYGNIFDKLQELKKKQYYKYNNQKYDLGLSVEDQIKNQIVSPYKNLINLIMGQNDFVKKQTDILLFVELYCREGNPDSPNIHSGEMEDKWWLYCKETDTKLLPAFRYILADAFITNNSKYEDIMNDLINKIGKIGDNGDAIVDEHSGEIIKYIDFDVSEGYKEGFVDKSRDILEKDAGDVILEKQKAKKEKRLSPEGQIVSNIVSTLSSNMGIDIESSRDLIVKIVTELMSDTKVIEKEAAYKEREKEAAKKGKKLPEYTLVYSSTLMYLTLGMYLIAIQTSIPSIRTRKTFPGCVRSFTGFPIEGEGDDTGLNYLACVALKNRDPSTMPWNALAKNEEKISGTIKLFIIRYLLPYGEVEQKIKEKVEYLLTNVEEDIPEEHSLNKWVNFLPPLKQFYVKRLDTISDGFREELEYELRTGNYKQLEKLLVIDSKIIGYSLAIQEAIQKIVEKKDLLLKSGSQPFIDNACCNEKENQTLTTLQYFININANIQQYNEIVNGLTALLKDIRILTQSAIMLSDLNTKRKFPEISNDFSDETIYYAFITLCKFQSSLPLTEDLAAVCIDKPDYLNKNDSIQEKISKLKRDGRNYTKDSFLRLFQIVSRNNIIKIAFSHNKPSCIEGLRNLLNDFDINDEQVVPKTLTQKLERLIDTYDISIDQDTADMRQIKNYLDTSNGIMRKELIEFIKLKAKVDGGELRKLTKFIQNINNWRFDKNQRNADIKIVDDAMYNCINFFKNFISLFGSVFPATIINKQMHSIEVPNRWGISQIHAGEIKKMLEDFYKPLDKFYGNNTISNVLHEIQNKCKSIILLSNVTPALTNIKIGEKEMYSVFDKRTSTLLFEYYFLSILSEYISLTKDPAMVTRMLVVPEKDESELFSTDFLIEQQMRFTETEQEYIQGDVSKLKENIAKLLVSYLNIMMSCKSTLDISFEDIEDRVFKLKEAEKYAFTDRLKDMDDEERGVDTILKKYKLGPIYSIGISKGIKEYDPDNYDHDKMVAEKVAEIQNKLRRQNRLDRDEDMEIEDAMVEMENAMEIERDIAMDMNPNDDYDDGDPWGEEMNDEIDYD